MRIVPLNIQEIKDSNNTGIYIRGMTKKSYGTTVIPAAIYF